MKENIEFKFTKPEESPGFLLWQVTMLWQRTIKRVLDPFEITHTQFVLLASLAWLSREKSIVNQADIAAQSRTDRMMVSKVLKTLQQKGLITRREVESDTRAKAITFTFRGSEIFQKALTVVEETDIKFFSVLGQRRTDFGEGMVSLLQQNT